MCHIRGCIIDEQATIVAAHLARGLIEWKRGCRQTGYVSFAIVLEALWFAVFLKNLRATLSRRRV